MKQISKLVSFYLLSQIIIGCEILKPVAEQGPVVNLSDPQTPSNELIPEATSLKIDEVSESEATIYFEGSRSDLRPYLVYSEVALNDFCESGTPILIDEADLSRKSIRLSGLKSSTNYHILLCQRKISSGKILSSKGIKSTLKTLDVRPGELANLIASQVLKDVKLEWTAAEGAKEYLVNYALNTSSAPSSCEGSKSFKVTELRTTIPNLELNQYVAIRVCAKNTNPLPSTGITSVIFLNTERPAPVSQIEVSNISYNSASLSWSNPNTASGIKFKISISEQSTASCMNQIEQSERTLTFTGLQASKFYYVAICTMNADLVPLFSAVARTSFTTTPPPACGSIPSGSSESRTRFETATVAYNATCKSQIQTRTCNYGNFSNWTGTYTHETCTPDLAPEVNYAASLTTLSGNSVNLVPTSYRGIEISFTPPLPAGLTANPNTGVISGTPTGFQSLTTYSATVKNSQGSLKIFSNLLSIKIDPKGCGTKTHGSIETRTRWQAADVPYTGTCYSQSQTRSCNNGVWQEWTGTYTAEACVKHPKPTVTYPNYTIVSGSNALISPFANSYIGSALEFSPQLPAGLTVNQQSGVISGIPSTFIPTTTFQVSVTDSFGTRVSNAASFNLTINPKNCDNNTVHGSYQYRTRFQTSVAANGQLCSNLSQNQQALCTNGQLGPWSGTYTKETCLQSDKIYTWGTQNASYYRYVGYTGEIPASPTAPVTWDAPPSELASLGLSLNQSTGTISGTFSKATLDASQNLSPQSINLSGKTLDGTPFTTVVTIGISPIPYMTYPEEVFLVVNQNNVVTPIAKYLNYFSLGQNSENLFSGVILSSSSGVISGKPTSYTTSRNIEIVGRGVYGGSYGGTQVSKFKLSTVDYPVLQYIVNYQTNNFKVAKDLYVNIVPVNYRLKAKYSLSGSLPSGLQLDPETGAIRGTPQVVGGPISFTVTAEYLNFGLVNGSKVTSSANLQITTVEEAKDWRNAYTQFTIGYSDKYPHTDSHTPVDCTFCVSGSSIDPSFVDRPSGAYTDTLPRVQFVKTTDAYAHLDGNGKVWTWGKAAHGGDSSAVSEALSSNVSRVSSTAYAFAALKSDGSVITWGVPALGGDSQSVSTRLRSGVIRIYASGMAFAALKSDGSVVTWGSPTDGGDSSTVASKLSSGVTNLFSTGSAFAALKSDGSVVTWGQSGGDSSSVAEKLKNNVSRIFANSSGFVALKGDGSLVLWGGIPTPNDPTLLDHEFTDVSLTFGAVAALRKGGGVSTWGSFSGSQVIFPPLSKLTNNVVKIIANQDAFAALKNDGSVVTWGNASSGGDYNNIRTNAGLRDGSFSVGPTVSIVASKHAFAALLKNGQVETWGNKLYGGDFYFSAGTSDPSYYGTRNLKNIVGLIGSSMSFSAIKADGEIDSWGTSPLKSNSITYPTYFGQIIHSKITRNQYSLNSMGSSLSNFMQLPASESEFNLIVKAGNNACQKEFGAGYLAIFDSSGIYPDASITSAVNPSSKFSVRLTDPEGNDHIKTIEATESAPSKWNIYWTKSGRSNAKFVCIERYQMDLIANN